MRAFRSQTSSRTSGGEELNMDAAAIGEDWVSAGRELRYRECWESRAYRDKVLEKHSKRDIFHMYAILAPIILM